MIWHAVVSVCLGKSVVIENSDFFLREHEEVSRFLAESER